MKKFIGYMLSVFVLLACEEQFNNIQDDIPQKLLDESTLQFSGEIIQSGSAEIDNINLWKVMIENPSGAVVNFYWQKRNNLLYQIEGIKGPFNYNIQPSVSVLNFSSAQFVAYESYLDEALSKWTLKRNDSDASKWIYIFELEGEEDPIVIDAVGGDFL
jgi:hypothetical protein